MQITKFIAFSAAATLATGTVAPGLARAETLPMQEVTVDYANLKNPAAVKAAKKAIRRAAIRVCQTPQDRERGPQSFDLPCFAKANGDAKRELDRRIAQAQSAKSSVLVMAAPEKH
jgi:UrcA family protein